MKRKKIGVIMTEVESYYQAGILKGIMQKSFALDYDVLVFSSFVKESFLKDYQYGEINIFNIINYDILDGIIILAETLKIPGLLDRICKEVDEKFSGPVVFIDYRYKNYDSVYVQDEKPFELLTDHLIEVHGCRKILFLSGDPNVATTQERLQGYKNSLKKHNIEIDDEFICFDGGFWYDKAAQVANHIIYGRRKKPDAIICCGDYMAIGVIHEYQKNGLKVPDDMKVLGYDATDEATACVPPITSCSPPLSEAGENAVNVLDARLKGTEPENFITGGGKIEIGASCGCREDYTYTKRDYLNHGSVIKYHELLNSNMMENFACSKDIDDLMSRIQFFLYLLIDWQEFYLCLNSNWLGGDNVYDEADKFCDGYTDDMIMYIRANRQNNRTLHEHFSKKEIFPGLNDEREKPVAYFITPLHFIKRSLGYAVFSYGNEVKSFDIAYRYWTKHVNNALESMRVQLSIANLAVRDSLTGVYSRLGIERNIQPLIDRTANRKNKFFLLVGDLNGLKGINDKYGHNAGDIAIKAVADALTASLKNNEICARTGGDEFVVLGCNDYWDDYPERFCNRVKERLDVYNKFADNPFDISVSLGGLCKRIKNINELQALYDRADKSMYAEKKLHKKNRT